MRTIAICLLLLAAAGLQAQPADPAALLSQTVTLQTGAEGLPLSEVSRQLQEQSGLPIDLEVESDPAIVASFQDAPLWVVLTQICTANGFDWDSSAAGVTVDEALVTRVFPIDTRLRTDFERRLQSGEIDRLVHTGDPEGGDESFYLYDPTLGILSMAGTPAAVDALAAVFAELASRESDTVELETRALTADARRVDQVEALLRSHLQVTDELDGDEELPLAGRGIRRTGNTLLVTETPENMQRLELLIQREGLLSAAADQDNLSSRRYNLLPAGPSITPTVSDQMADRTLSQISAILGLEPGQSEGGRRLHHDPVNQTVSVTAEPADLLRIELALAEVTAAQDRRQLAAQVAEGQRQQQQGPSLVQRLARETQWATRPSGVRIGSDVGRGSGTGSRRSGGSSSAAGGNTVSTSLRQDGEFVWRDYRITLLRTRGRGNNSEAEILISDLAGRSGDQVSNLKKHRSTITGDLRVRVTDISTSGNRVRVELTDLRR